MSADSTVAESMVDTISYINGFATLFILLLCVHFIYNIYIKQRVSAASVTIKISNKSHFKSISLLQILIFILTIISCIICTFFISNLFLSISSTTCTAIYSLSYSCWFIARYLCILMFIFRLQNISKLFSSKSKKILITLSIITTIINIPILIFYLYISSPSLITNQSSNTTLCTDETRWFNKADNLNINGDNVINIVYFILNCINILIIIMIWFIYIYELYFLKNHNISSIFSYSYQSLAANKPNSTKTRRNNISHIDRSNANDDEKTGLKLQITDNSGNKEREASSSSSSSSSSPNVSSDVISSAIAATLQNAEVTIGANRRKRNYTADPPSKSPAKPIRNKAFVPKPEILAHSNEQKTDVTQNVVSRKVDTKELTKMSDQLQIRRPRGRGRAKVLDENTSITLNVEQKNNNNNNNNNDGGGGRGDGDHRKDEQYVDELRFVAKKEFVFITIFILVIVIGICLMEFVVDNDKEGVIILYWNGISGFINSLCSWMLFNYNNDLWYDIMRYIECYCFYDCCWKHFDCFIWDKDKNCCTFCCGYCIKDKVHDSDDDDDGNNNNNKNIDIVDNKKEMNGNENKNNNETKSIYVRGSLRRLHQK